MMTPLTLNKCTIASSLSSKRAGSEKERTRRKKF